jgi:hypothetical protein
MDDQPALDSVSCAAGGLMNGVELAVTEWLNSIIGASPGSFHQAMTLIDRLPWIIAALFFAGFWFVGEGGTVATREDSITRIESRTRLVLLWLSIIVGVVIAHLLSTMIMRQPPLIALVLRAPIQPAALKAIQDSLMEYSTFPAVDMVVFFSLVTGAFRYNGKIGSLLLVIYLCFTGLYLGLGLVWLADVISGAALGILITTVFLHAGMGIRKPLIAFVLAFNRSPRLLYPVAFLILFDLSQKLGVLAYALS